jgi:ubiquinone/menaquinone biosynthesis C-methylase UbiE/uncharacterized protein YbaR (Trm112 family)
MRFVCPACKGSLEQHPDSYRCAACARRYPIVCAIPDFRLVPDPYIGMEEDRKKGEMLSRAAETRTFEELIRFYYSVTPEDPPDLAEHWIAHALAELEIGTFTFDAYELAGGRFLDLGCSTGAMLAAASHRCESVTGVDVAFRWLVAGACRLRELGVSATLVCANAEYLPFPGASFDRVTAVDLLEHVSQPQLAVNEAYRVSKPGAASLFLTNNRYAPLPDPQVRMWGVGLLPRRWQGPYVAFRRSDLHRYRVAMRSAWEMKRLCRRAGYDSLTVEAAILHAPHLPGKRLQRLLVFYNLTRRWPLIRALLKWVGPKLAVVAVHPAATDSPSSTVAREP